MAKRKKRRKNPVGSQLSDKQFDRLNDLITRVEKLSNDAVRLAGYMPSPVNKMLENLDEGLETWYEKMDEWLDKNT